MSILHNRPDLSFIEDLDLRYANEAYSLTDYDVCNINTICSSILGDAGDQVVLGPTSFVTMLLGSIACAVGLLNHSLKSQSDAMHKVLNKGDIVRLDGKCGRFLGVGSFQGSVDSRPKLKVQFRDGLVVGIDLDQAWRLTKCAPGRRRIDRFDKKVQQTTRPYYVLRELLGFKKNEIPPALNVKLPVVAIKRESVLHYPNMSIGDLPCPSVLPAGYYSSEERFERLGNDPLQRDPIVCFTSDFEVAASIASNHRITTGVLVCDHRKLRGNLSRVADLQGNGKRTVLLSGVSSMEADDIANFERLGFKIVSWTSSALRDTGTKPVSLLQPTSQNPLVRAGCLLHNVAYGKTGLLTVDSAEGEQIGKLMDRLHLVSNSMSHTDDLRRFLGISYGFLMQRACLPLSLQQLDMLGYHHEGLMNELDRLLMILHTTAPSSVTALLDEIREGIICCADNHEFSHPKHEVFREAVNGLGVGDCVLVRNNKDKRILREWLLKYAEPFRVSTLGQALDCNEAVLNCLSLGWYGRRHSRLKYSGFHRNDTTILYPFESRWKEANSRATADYLRKVSTGAKPISDTASTELTSPDLEEIIDRISAEWGHSLLGRQSESADDLSTVEAIPVAFEEDYVAFLTPGHNCRSLDEEGERIVVKRVTELRRGDLLVFVKGSAEDIFDKLTGIIKRSNADIRKQADLAELWKEVLLRYIQVHDLSLREFQERLRQVGVERTVATIRTWREKDCIGPEDDALRGIARITQEPELNARLDDVLEACRQMRSLHVGLGRYLARAIVSSAASDLLPEKGILLQQVSGDLSAHAEIVTVRETARKEVRVPLNKTNRLLSKFLDV